MTDIITKAEAIAWQIMGDAGRVRGWNTTEVENIHEIANRFIELAERIKSERLVAVMLKGER